MRASNHETHPFDGSFASRDNWTVDEDTAGYSSLTLAEQGQLGPAQVRHTGMPWELLVLLLA